MAPQPLAALDVQQVRPVRPVAEQHQDGRAAAAGGGRCEQRRHLHRRGRTASRRSHAGATPARPRSRPGSRERAELDQLRGRRRVGRAEAEGRAQSATGHAPQAGCARGRSGGRARSSGATGGQSLLGMSSPPPPRPSPGPRSVVQPNRRDSRPKCVSTVMPGMPNALPSTTFAVLRPTPGSVTSSSSVLGTSPPNRSHSAGPGPSGLVLAWKNPVDLRIFSSSSRSAAA